MRAIIMLGPPGAGKGAISQLLSKKLNIAHISTGDLFREEIKKDSPLSEEIRRIMDEGRLISADITLDLLKKRLESIDSGGVFILDGFPRNLDQAKLLDSLVPSSNSLVINFVLDDDLVVKRVTSRLVCNNCKRIYNSLTVKPKVDGFCDSCNNEVGKLIQREDDKETIVRKRLKVYHEETQPLIDFYNERFILVDVDASPSIDEVLNVCLEVINNLK